MRKAPYIKKDKVLRAAFARSEYARPGVYIIRVNNKPVYVGSSESNVYKTMYRHFQSWSDPTQRRVVYSKRTPGLTVEVFKLPVDKVRRKEAELLRALKPRDNENKIRTLFDQDLEPLDFGEWGKVLDIEDPF